MSEKRDWLKIFSPFKPDAREPINEWLQRLIDYWSKNGEPLTFHAMRGGWNRHGRKLFPEISDRDCSAKHISTGGKKQGMPLKVEEKKQDITLKDDAFHEKVLAKIKREKTSHTIESLSDHFDTGIGKVKDAIKTLKGMGFNVSDDNGNIFLDNTIPKSDATILDVKKMSTGFYKFGVTGDNHLCSRYERLDVLNALYDIYERDGINIVFNTGNWIDGEARFNMHDLNVHGIDRQLDYFIANYPQREGIITKFITGDDHEGWYTQREGINIGKYAERKAIEAGRNDLVYLGHMEHDEIIQAKNGYTKLRVLHPGGGSSYAISYTSQKIVESYTGADKPHILLDGHYHKAGYNYIRGVHVIQTATTQDQTPFMRKKKLAAHLGGWEIEFSTDDNGAITRFKGEFFPFYDKEYYLPDSEKWKYKF